METNSSDYTKKQVLNSVTNNLKVKGFERILSKANGEKDPFKIVWKGSDEGIKPDIITITNNQMHIFSIEMDYDKPSEDILSKWNLLSTYAKEKEGNLYIVSPKSVTNKIRNTIEIKGNNIKFLEVV